jgi:hypothetical protein
MAGKPGRSGTNKGKDKIWSEAIRRAVLRTTADKKTRRLDALADKLVSAGIDGDIPAIKEIGDRLEGKPTQMVAGDPDGSPLTVVLRKFSDRTDPAE